MVIITCKRRAGAGGELEHFLLFSTKGRIQWSCRLSINEFQTRTTTQIHHQESMFDTAECALPWFQSKFRIFRFLRHEGSRYHRKVCHPTGKRRQRRRWDRWGLARLNGRYTDSKQRVAVMYQAWWRQGQRKGWWVSVVHVYNDHSRSDKSETGYASGSAGGSVDGGGQSWWYLCSPKEAKAATDRAALPWKRRIVAQIENNRWVVVRKGVAKHPMNGFDRSRRAQQYRWNNSDHHGNGTERCLWAVDIPGSRPESDENASRREDDAGWWSRQSSATTSGCCLGGNQ